MFSMVEFCPLCISIHALREEGDNLVSAFLTTLVDFYPRPPRGGRHADNVPDVDYESISIHALREEGDSPAPKINARTINFYPRPPRGGRLG